jgi:site-specific DNA recombinase
MKKPATNQSAATYARISHEDQSQFSLPSQQAACESLAAAKGYQTSEEFTFIDNGGLSTELDREGLERLREAVRAGLVQAVVIYSIDRLSRKVVHQLLLLEEFEKQGVEVLFVDAPADSSPEGKMLLQIKGLFGEYEREKIRERTSRGSRRRAQEGKINGRPVFGYVATENGLLIPHEERAAIVRRIFALVIEGKSCGDIAELFNLEGVATPTGRRWIRGTVLQIVNRDAYHTGRLPWGRTTAAEPKRRRKPARAGKSKLTSLKQRPPADWLHLTIPTILDAAAFNAAQQAIAANRKWKSGRPSQTYTLTGLVRCGRCGAAVCGGYSHGHTYYKCSGQNPVTGKRSCRERGIRLDAIEPMIWSDAVTTLTDVAKLAALYGAHFAETAAKESDHAAERADLAVKIEKLKRREFRCRQSMLDTELADSYQSFRDDLKVTSQQRQSLERRLEAIAPAQNPLKPESFIEFCSLMERAWGITDRGEQREFLRACVDEIRLTQEVIDIRFSLNVAAMMAAIAAIGPEPDPDSGTNCQLRQCCKIDRTPDPRRQSTRSSQRHPSRTLQRHRPHGRRKIRIGKRFQTPTRRPPRRTSAQWSH